MGEVIISSNDCEVESVSAYHNLHLLLSGPGKDQHDLIQLLGQHLSRQEPPILVSEIEKQDHRGGFLTSNSFTWSQASPQALLK